MKRTYDSSRRAQAAQRTREQILEAAFRLHGRGIVDYETLAAEANVSVATIRKHFPTRENLFENCTAWGSRYADDPDIDRIAATEDAGERVRLAVQETFAFYESLFGHIWLSYLHQRESPVLAAAVVELEELCDQVAELALAPWPLRAGRAAEARGMTVGFLSFLTYRALRHDGGLSPEETAERITDALQHGLEVLCREAGGGVATTT
jgi:AcrR family transcriptional regulator